MLSSEKNKVVFVLIPVFIIAACMALVNLRVGAPQVNIDDCTLYEGGFLVWFGHVPPQHAYLECWINGAVSLVTFLVKEVFIAQKWDAISLEFVSRAYSDFYYNPDAYYAAYRFVVIIFNLATALLVYLSARLCIRKKLAGYAPAFAAILYLFSFNTFWCILAGRPDSLVAFFSLLGVFLYMRSNYRDDSPWFWLAGVAFGLAAGLKLHGAFFAIFAALDILRVKGFRKGMRSISILAILSVLFFMVADGSLLFDPLKYLKARWLTYKDDYSAYMNLGGQFVTVLRGSGWVMAPLVLVSWLAIRNEGRDSQARSVAFMALCWLALFVSIRQLRSYWMLPALPLIYISAILVIDRMQKAGVALAVIAVAVFVSQSVAEVQKIHTAPYNDLRNWVGRNISDKDFVYLIGYSVLKVPRSTRANTLWQSLVECQLAGDAKKYGFTCRHLKNWEELTKLRLLDMLIPQEGKGLNIIGYLEHGTEFDQNEDFLHQFNYFIVQDKFGFENRENFDSYLKRNYIFITQLVGEGGEGYGLNYKIYKRNQAH